MDDCAPVQRSEPRIQPKVLLAIVPALGLLIYNGTLMPKDGGLHVVVTATSMGFMLLVPTVLVYFIGGRSLRAATVTYCVMSGVLFLSQFGAYRRITRDRVWEQFRAELQPVLQGYHQRLEQDLDGGEGMAPSEQEIRVQFTEALWRAANKMEGSPRRAALGIAKLFEGMQDEARAFEVVYAELEADYPLDIPSLTSLEAIQSRMRIIDRYAVACRSLLDVVRNVPERLREALRSEGVPGPDIEGILSGAVGTGGNAELIRFRELDLVAVSTMRQVLELLELYWGKWEYNPQTQDVDTASDELKTLLLRHISRVQTILAEQDALQRQRVGKIRDRLHTIFKK